MTSLRLASLVSILLALTSAHSPGQSLAVGQAEASRCMDQIASVRREMLNKYSDTLTELQAQFQKTADLEGALAVRAEIQRLQKDQSLTEKDLVPEPNSLRAAQQQAVGKIQELAAAVVNDSIPKLIEIKKALTVAGKLDDAVAVRGLIEKLQGDYIRIERPDPTLPVPADTVIQAYAADRSRADKAYKGARITVRGVVGTFRTDPNDPKSYVVYLKGVGNTGWIACFFSGGNVKFREEKQLNTSMLVLVQKDGDVIARLEVNKTATIQGQCDGFEDVVRLTKCEIAR